MAKVRDELALGLAHIFAIQFFVCTGGMDETSAPVGSGHLTSAASGRGGGPGISSHPRSNARTAARFAEPVWLTGRRKHQLSPKRKKSLELCRLQNHRPQKFAVTRSGAHGHGQ